MSPHMVIFCALAIPGRAARARLHRERDHALVDQPIVDDHGRRLEDRVDVALLELEQDAEVGSGLRV